MCVQRNRAGKDKDIGLCSVSFFCAFLVFLYKLYKKISKTLVVLYIDFVPQKGYNNIRKGTEEPTKKGNKNEKNIYEQI